MLVPVAGGCGIPDHHVVEEATAVELAVRRCVATSLSRCETGERFYISLNTVKTCTRELHHTLDLRSPTDLIRARPRALGLRDRK